MIYAVGTDHQRVTVISDGAIYGRSIRGDDDWDTKTGIGVALIRMYIDWRPNARMDIRCFGHYYLVNVNMAMTTELVARACLIHGLQHKKHAGKIAYKFARAVPIEIMAYEHSYKDMLRSLKELTDINDFFKYTDDPFSS